MPGGTRIMMAACFSLGKNTSNTFKEPKGKKEDQDEMLNKHKFFKKEGKILY